MPFGKGRRKLLIFLGALLAGLIAVWFACPFWFPWVLRPLGSRAGLRVGTYERLGYSRFAVGNLLFTNESLVLHSEQVDALIPTVWLWRLAARRTGTEHFLRVTNWDCRLLPSNTPSPPPYKQVEDLASVLHLLGRWLPGAVLFQGTVHSGDLVFTIPDATWNTGKLQADVKLPAQLSGESLSAQLTQAQPLKVVLASPLREVDSTFELATNQTGLDIHDLTFWQSNRIEFAAHFGPKDFLPAQASLLATNVQFPGDLARLPAYREIGGSLSAQWENTHFALELTAAAKPTSTESNLPPADIRFRAQGTTNAATIQTLEIQSPILQAQLSSPVNLAFAAPFLQGPATLHLGVDLGQQHWIAVSGKVSGEAEINSGQGRLPIANVRLTGSNVGNDTIKASSAAIAAKLDWPSLEVSQAELRFDDGSGANLRGKLNLEQKSATAGQFQFAGPLARRWLPQGYSYDTLSITGKFEGELDKLAHSGGLAASGIVTPALQPCRLELQWNGQAESLDHFELHLDETNSAVIASGSLKVQQEPIQMTLDHLELSTNRSTAMALSNPVSFTIVLPKTGRGLRVDSTALRLNGSAGEMATKASVGWPEWGAMEISLRRFPLELLSQFANASFPLVHVGRLDASVNWSNGPAVLSVDASGTELAQLSGKGDGGQQKPRIDEEAVPTAAAQLLATPLNFELRVNGSEHGLVLSNFVVSTATSSVAIAHGFLPLTIAPSSSNNLINMDGNRELQLNASIRPHAFFWETVAQLIGVRLGEPTLDLDLSGTWDRPQGNINFHAQEIVLGKTNPPSVNLRDLRLTLSLDREKARLSEGQVLVQGQRVSLTAELPLGEGAWKGLLHKRLPDLEKTTAHVRVENAELSAFEPLFPKLLAAQGNLNLDLQLFPGPRLEGALIVRRARTRPLGNTAPFRDINVTLRFHDQMLLLENAAANLSGADVNITGKVDWHGTNWLSEGLPPFEIALRGTNVPLAREPEYIIRSDLDLAITKTNGASALIFGTAHLRDSFYLSDLAALLPGRAETPGSRPPYFSIDNPTLANWRLAVTAEGVRWLKVRTTLFNGEVSANLHLEGTLEQPVALGVLKIDSGIVRFPFANLQVQQGLVTLDSQDPYHPHLLVRANSKQFGYDIHMEATGPADTPVIQFTSNPPLSSQQILLMITAGQLPPGTFSLTPQQRAQTVALFLGRDLLAKLGFGDQSQERLTISSGEEISEQGRPTYRVEYKLTNRWSVEGEYDRFGDFNADLKWRIYSK